jgi:hypothetical protein
MRAYLFLVLGLLLASPVAQAAMSCTVQMPKHEAKVTIDQDSKLGWSTAIVVGESPEVFTVGLSAQPDLSQLVDVELASGAQPEMGVGPGHYTQGTLIESTKVQFNGKLQIVMNVPSLNLTVICDPFGA